MAQEISEKAREFDEDIKATMLEHAPRLNASEAYEALCLAANRVMGAIVAHLKTTGTSEAEIKALFDRVVTGMIKEGDSGKRWKGSERIH